MKKTFLPYAIIVSLVAIVAICVTINSSLISSKEEVAGEAIRFPWLLPSSCPSSSVTIRQSDIVTRNYFINSPGVYCLSENLSVDKDFFPNLGYPKPGVIEIFSDNVVLDLNGYSIVNPDGSEDLNRMTRTLEYTAIIIRAPHRNVSIHGGKIIGFDRGIFSEGNIAFGVPGNKQIRIGKIQIYDTALAIYVNSGDDVVISRNLIRGALMGIAANHKAVKILENDIPY